MPTVTLGSLAGDFAATLSSSSTTGNQWLRNGQAIAGATDRTYRVLLGGNYSVRVTVGQCSATSQAVAVTSLDEDLAGNSVSLSPNPVNGTLEIEVKGFKNMLSVKIFSLSGKELYAGRMESSLKRLDASHLPQGMYVLVLQSDEGKLTKKFVKE